MILALDVGNTQIHGGVFEGDSIRLQFRKNTRPGSSSDEIGLFFRSVLRENGLDPTQIRQIAICSVVPEVQHSIGSACIKYFGIQPFLLQSGVKTGLRIKYRNPLEVGADRIANSIAGTQLHPGKNLILIDLGTATTFDVVTSERDYLGGVILPGLKISMEALESSTSKLRTVEILRPTEIVGRSTTESIQSGLFFGHVYAIRGIVEQIQRECFSGSERALVIGTGGFSRLLDSEDIFDAVVPELVLFGLHRAIQMNL